MESEETLRRVQLLAMRASQATPSALWRVMPVTLRRRGLQAALDGEGAEDVRRHAKLALAEDLPGFRPSAIAKWPDAELVQNIVRLKAAPAALVEEVLRAAYLHEDPAVQIEFFNAVGIEHRDGIVEQLRTPAADDGRVNHAATVLLDSKPSSIEALVYLLAIATMHRKAWPSLIPWLERRFAEGGNGEAPAEGSAQAQRVESDDDGPAKLSSGEPRRSRNARTRLTALDEVIVNRVVESRAHGLAAPDERVLDDIIQQFVQLQPLRHESCYHLGFRDGTFDREVARALPAGNSVRWRWYFAGWITGRARIKDSAAITSLYDKEPLVRSLGDGGPASEYAAAQVTAALAEVERHTEAAEFLTPTAFVACGASLAKDVLTRASGLLRVERSSEAKAYLDRLLDGLRMCELAEQWMPEDLLPDTLRRLAHCLRHEGLFSASRELLEDQLLDEMEPRFRAMVLADIALMDSGFNRLSAIDIPQLEGEVDGTVAALRRGEARFREVAQFDCAERSHGRYALGVIALLEQRYAEAFSHLEFSASAFARSYERYRAGGLISRARFLAALAGFMMEGEDLRAAQLEKWLNEGLEVGMSVPRYFLEPLLTGALVKDEDCAGRLVSVFLTGGDRSVLEALVALDVPHSRTLLAEALLTRFLHDSRSTEDEAAFLRKAYSLFHEAADYERAATALEHLHSLAHEGVGVEPFIDVLRSSESVSGVWDTEDRIDALSSILEQNARYAEAALELSRLFHRTLAGHRFEYLDSAEDILLRVQSYGESGLEIAVGLRDRLNAIRATLETEEPTPVIAPSSYRVNVVVVGGNETQERYEKQLVEWGKTPEANVDLRFIFTGWTSNWGPFVAEFERTREWSEGVVVLRFIRTELGRAIRKRCDGKAQLGCWGHGAQSIRRAVMRVATMARARQAQ